MFSTRLFSVFAYALTFASSATAKIEAYHKNVRKVRANKDFWVFAYYLLM